MYVFLGIIGNFIIVGYMCCDLFVWFEVMLCCFLVYGVICNDIFFVSYGYGLFIGGLGVYYGVENLGVIVILVFIGNMEKYVCLICDLGIMGIVCIFLYVFYLVEVVECMGLIKNDINFCIGVFGVELWMESMCKEIEEWLGLKGYNIYGLSEIMGFGVFYEC